MGICDDAGFGAVSEFEAGGLIGLIGRECAEVVVWGLAAKGVVENENREEGEDDKCKGSCTGWTTQKTCLAGVQVCDASKKACACEISCKIDDHSCKQNSNTRTVCQRSSATGCMYWKESQSKFQCGQGIYKDKPRCDKGTCR